MKLWKRVANTSAAMIEWLMYRFGKKLKKYKLTQAEFGRMVGISRGAISNYVKERRFPDEDFKQKIINAAKRLRIKIKLMDFIYNDKKTAKYKDMIKVYINRYWEEMKKINPVFEAYEFIYHRERMYAETGRRFISPNFPYPDWIPEYKPNERCQLGNPNGPIKK